MNTAPTSSTPTQEEATPNFRKAFHDLYQELFEGINWSECVVPKPNLFEQNQLFYLQTSLISYTIHCMETSKLFIQEVLKIGNEMRTHLKPPTEPQGFESTPEGFEKAAMSAARFFASL